MKIMVAYDGTLQAKEALVYGLDKAREKGGEVVALHVFNKNLFIDYDATIDAQGITKAEAEQFINEAKAIIRDKGKGVKASLFSTEGNPTDEMISFAKSEHVDIMLCPPRFVKIINKYQRALAESELTSEAATLNVTALSAKRM
jgi:nucleotide-binding universal stress UspA family protein